MTKKDLLEAIVPQKCRDCEHLIISYATGLIKLFNRPVATCRLHHADTTRNDLRGTFIPCSCVIASKCEYKQKSCEPC